MDILDYNWKGLGIIFLHVAVLLIFYKAYFNMFIVVWNTTKCNSYQLPNIVKLEHPTDMNRVRVEHHGP
jgi:hypothetical protein